MRLHLLGTAAGGGVPQWNCCCANCQAARFNPVVARSQSQLAISGDGGDWLLINASPDLREQLSRTPELHPRAELGVRNTPVAGVVLTSADLDHILGLLLMREFTPVSVYATESVLRVIASNAFFSMLQRMPDQQRIQILHHGNAIQPSAGVTITPVKLRGNFPMYVPHALRDSLDSGEMTIGLIIESSTGRRVAFLPSLPALTPHLLEQIAACDVLLVDGTVWSEDELQRLQAGTPSATEMGHMPIGGATGSLEQLRQLDHVRRIYTHINNSNPILTAGSPEQAEVLDAGFEIAFDGMEIVL